MGQKVSVERTLVYGCLHTPFQHKKSQEALYDFIKYWRPNRIIENGDIHDLYNASRWFRNPDRKYYLQDEIDEARIHNANIRRVAGRGCEIIRNWGNHEFRWDHYLQSNAPDFAGLEDLQFEKVFHLERNNIIPNRGKRNNYARYNLGQLQIGHFEVARLHSAATERHLVDTKGCNIIASHSHRKGSFFKTLGNGTVLGGIGTGCLCDPDQQDYTEDPNWQHGFVLVEKLIDKDRFHLTDVNVIGGDILYDGRLF